MRLGRKLSEVMFSLKIIIKARSASLKNPRCLESTEREPIWLRLWTMELLQGNKWRRLRPCRTRSGAIWSSYKIRPEMVWKWVVKLMDWLKLLSSNSSRFINWILGYLKAPMAKGPLWHHYPIKCLLIMSSNLAWVMPIATIGTVRAEGASLPIH